MKICTSCKIEKDLEDFPKRKDSKDGRRAKCNICMNEKARTYYDEVNREKKLASNKIWAKEHKEEMLKWGREYYERNSEKQMEKSKKWRKENPEEWKILTKRHYQKHKEEIRIERKSFRDNNKEKLKEQRKEYRQSEAWKIAKKNDSNRRRSEKIKTSNGTISTKALKELIIKQDYKCKYCNCDLDFSVKNSVHLDHVVPLSKGGTHTIENVVYSCASCNLQKGASLLVA